MACSVFTHNLYLRLRKLTHRRPGQRWVTKTVNIFASLQKCVKSFLQETAQVKVHVKNFVTQSLHFFYIRNKYSIISGLYVLYDLKVLFLKNKKMATKKQALYVVELICKK